MSALDTTLNQVFDLKDKKLSEDNIAEIESAQSVLPLKETLSKEAPDVKWQVALSGMIDRVGDLLDIGIPDVMVRAWNKSGILKKCLDRKSYDPNETVLVPLAEQTIKSTHRPYVEILVNERRVGKIDFEIDVALVVSGIILKIQDAKVKQIVMGTAKGKGTIKCSGLIIIDRKLKTLQMPGVIDLGEGIPIAP